MIWIICYNSNKHLLEKSPDQQSSEQFVDAGFRQPVWVQAWLQSATKSGESSWSLQIGEFVAFT